MPIFQPILEQRNAPTMVRPGVQDNSTASRIASFGEQAIDLYTGYQEAALENKIESTLEDHFKPIREAEIDIASTDIAVEQAWKRASQEAIDVSEISTVEEIHQKKLNLYQQAVSTGKMSASELEARILADTRAAINRNPGLTDILLKRADRVLEMSGASSYIKAAKQEQVDVQKQQQEQLKNLRELADQHNIPYDPFNPDYSRITQAVNQSKVEKASSDAVQRASQGLTAFTKEQGLQFVQKNGDAALIGDMDELRSQLTNLYSQSTTKDYASIKYQANAVARSLSDKWYAAAARAGISNEPAVKDLITRQEASIKAITDRLESLKSGDDFKKVLDNEVNAMQLTQRAALYKEYDIEAIDLASKIASQSPDLFKQWAVGSGKYDTNDAIKTFGGLVNRFLNKSTVNSMSSKNIDGKKPDAVNFLKETIKLGDKQGITNMLGTFSDGYSKIQDTSSRLSFLEQSVRELGNVANTENLKGLQTDGVNNGMNLINTYMNQVAPQMILGINSAMKENKGEDRVSFDVLPNGTLTVSSSNKDLERKLNSKFIIRINESLAATANLQGVTPKAIAGKFYNQHFGKWIPELSTDKDLTEAPQKETKAPSASPGVIVRGEQLGPKVEKAVLDFIDRFRE